MKKINVLNRKYVFSFALNFSANNIYIIHKDHSMLLYTFIIPNCKSYEKISKPPFLSKRNKFNFNGTISYLLPVMYYLCSKKQFHRNINIPSFFLFFFEFFVLVVIPQHSGYSKTFRAFIEANSSRISSTSVFSVSCLSILTKARSLNLF